MSKQEFMVNSICEAVSQQLYTEFINLHKQIALKNVQRCQELSDIYKVAAVPNKATTDPYKSMTKHPQTSNNYKMRLLVNSIADNLCRELSPYFENLAQQISDENIAQSLLLIELEAQKHKKGHIIDENTKGYRELCGGKSE